MKSSWASHVNSAGDPWLPGGGLLLFLCCPRGAAPGDRGTPPARAPGRPPLKWRVLRAEHSPYRRSTHRHGARLACARALHRMASAAHLRGRAAGQLGPGQQRDPLPTKRRLSAVTLPGGPNRWAGRRQARHTFVVAWPVPVRPRMVPAFGGWFPRWNGIFSCAASLLELSFRTPPEISPSDWFRHASRWLVRRGASAVSRSWCV